MFFCSCERRGVVVRLLVLGRSGDAVVLDTRESVIDSRGKVWGHLFRGKVETDVAIEIAVGEITRISLFRRPDRLGGFTVPSESNGTQRRFHGNEWISGIHNFTRRRKLDRVRLNKEEIDPLVLQHCVQAGNVSALRKPYTPGTPTEHSFINPASNTDLPVDTVGRHQHVRQECMSGGAGDNFQEPVFLQTFESPD